MAGMEKFDHVVINDGWKLPLGVRFHPTDEELLVYYLRRKCLFLPLPASIIPEFDVFVTSPWNLPGSSREKRYFFSNKEQDMNTDKRFRKDVLGFGCWKQKGKERKIVVCNATPIVGIRRTLIFHEGTHSNFTKMRWIMHVFHLEGLSPKSSNSMQMPNVGCGNWKVYKVFRKKIRFEEHGNIVSQPNAVVIDFKNEDSVEFSPPPPPSPPSPSVVDEKETTI